MVTAIEPIDGRGVTQREAERDRQCDHGYEQNLELVAVVGRQQQSSESEQAREPHRAGAGVHRVELVQADPAEHDQADRENEPSFDDQEEGEGDRRESRPARGRPDPIVPPGPCRPAPGGARVRGRIRPAPNRVPPAGRLLSWNGP